MTEKECRARGWILAWCRDPERLPRGLGNPAMRISNAGICKVLNVLAADDPPIAEGATWLDVANELIAKGASSWAAVERLAAMRG